VPSTCLSTFSKCKEKYFFTPNDSSAADAEFLSSFFVSTAISSISSIYLPCLFKYGTFFILQAIRIWFHLLVAAISFCYVYYASVYQYRLISITMSDSHQWSIPFSWNTVTTATINLWRYLSFIRRANERFLVHQSAPICWCYAVLHAPRSPIPASDRTSYFPCPFFCLIVYLAENRVWLKHTTGAIHSISALSQPRACCYILFSMLNCFFSITSVVSSTSADDSQNIRCRRRRGQWSRRPLRDTTLLRRTYILKINKFFTDSVVTGCNFNFKQCLWRQIQNTDGGIRRNWSSPAHRKNVCCSGVPSLA